MWLQAVKGLADSRRRCRYVRLETVTIRSDPALVLEMTGWTRRALSAPNPRTRHPDFLSDGRNETKLAWVSLGNKPTA